MHPLVDLIRGRIRDGGPLPFATFMDLALYHPLHGYYRSGPPIGRRGDFFTAPQVAAGFGRAVGRCFRQALAALGLPAGALLELGAGDGRLATDVVCALGPDAAPAAVHLLDQNTARLPRHMAGYAGEITVHENLGVIAPASFRGMIYANEFFDALPVRRFRRSRAGLREAHVAWRRDRFRETWLPAAAPEVLDYLARYGRGGVGRLVFEYSPGVPGIFRELRRITDRAWIVIIDYGDRAGRVLDPARPNGTLRAFHRHRVLAGLLARPGRQDLTADVNFDFLADQARENGFETISLETQGQFLARHGFLEEFQAAGDARAWAVNLPLRQLLLPGGMGEVFKGLVLRG